MKRCTLVIPDAGPLNSLWVAGELALLLRLDMRVILVDAVQDEVTKDPATYQKDREVAEFIAGNQPPFVRVETDIWKAETERRRKGKKPKRNAGELAISDFLTADDGLKRWIAGSDPVMLLFEDRDIRVFNKPPNLHLLSTVGMLRGMERVGLVGSADDVIERMTKPSLPGRRPSDRRVFTDLPAGIDEQAAISSSWMP